VPGIKPLLDAGSLVRLKIRRQRSLECACRGTTSSVA
jgi:hypothetical protein